MRTGILSDSQHEKECVAYLPPPMNRTDLLPPNYANTSGVYTRKLKNPKVVSRPVSLMAMAKSIENVSGVNPIGRIEAQARKEIQFRPIKYEGAKINPYYEYLNQAEQVGTLSSVLEGSDTPPFTLTPTERASPVSGLVSPTEAPAPSPATTPSSIPPSPELDPEEAEAERQLQFDIRRQAALGLLPEGSGILTFAERPPPVSAERPTPVKPMGQVPPPVRPPPPLPPPPPRGLGYRVEELRAAGLEVPTYTEEESEEQFPKI